MIFTSSIALIAFVKREANYYLEINIIHEKQQFVKVISFQNLSSLNSKLAHRVTLRPKISEKRKAFNILLFK
mgnify:CR=1 FL=1